MVRPTGEENAWLQEQGSSEIGDSLPLATLLKRPEISFSQLSERWGNGLIDLAPTDQERVETEIKFEGYLRRQELDIERMQKMEGVAIPADFRYDELQALSIEVRERLKACQPNTLGQASRISGVTPAAVSAISIYLRKHRAGQASNRPMA